MGTGRSVSIACAASSEGRSQERTSRQVAWTEFRPGLLPKEVIRTSPQPWGPFYRMSQLNLRGLGHLLQHCRKRLDRAIDLRPGDDEGWLEADDVAIHTTHTDEYALAQ
jgi:hypothetical protein